MALSDEQYSILNNEVAKSKRAEQAYNLFIKEHIEITVKQIYDGIEQCSIGDAPMLLKLKSALSALRGLESSVLSAIESGKLARITLEQENG